MKRDAVAGLASLAKSEANKPLMGSTGALEALVQLAFTSEDNPTTLLTDVPKAAKTPGAVYKPRSPGSISPGTARRVGGGFVDDHRLTRRRRGFDETAAEGPAAFSTLAIEAYPDPDPDPSEPEPEPEPEKNAPDSPAPAAAAPSSPAAATPPRLEVPDDADADADADAPSGTPRSTLTKRALGDVVVTRCAARAVASLLTDRENRDAFVGKFDGLAKIQALVPATKNVDIRASLASMLDSVARDEGYATRLFDSGGVKTIMDLASTADAKTCLKAASCARRLSRLRSRIDSWPPECVDGLVTWLGAWIGHDELCRVAVECVANVCEDSEAHRARLVDVGGVPRIATFLNVDRYEDDVRVMAARCLSRMAKNPECRPKLAIPAVLEAFKRSVEANAAVANAEQLRNSVETVAALADCGPNKKKLADHGYVDALFATMATVRDKQLRRLCTTVLQQIASDPPCREMMRPYVDRIVDLMAHEDPETQHTSARLATEIACEENCRKDLVPKIARIVAMLNTWAESPDPSFNKMAVDLGSELAVEPEMKEEVTRSPGGAAMLRAFLAQSKSRDPDVQLGLASFLGRMAEGGDEEVKAGLVRAGAVWRLKSLRDDAKEQAARLRAGHTLKNSLGLHYAAIRIQARFRGILHRLRERRREREAKAREEKEAKEAMEAKMREAAGGGGPGGPRRRRRRGEDINLTCSRRRERGRQIITRVRPWRF